VNSQSPVVVALILLLVLLAVLWFSYRPTVEWSIGRLFVCVRTHLTRRPSLDQRQHRWTLSTVS
jgi:hypothetical protein